MWGEPMFPFECEDISLELELAQDLIKDNN